MSEPVIMVAEGKYGSCHWRQYFVITEGRCVVVEMLRAMLAGWKFHRVHVQAGDYYWPQMTRDQIVAYKLDSAYPPAMAPDLGDFRAKLLAVAESGKLPERAS